MNTNSKSVEELENDYWGDETEFRSNLLIRCHRYRKIPIRDLTTEQLRLLISQKVGVEYLAEIAIEKLESNVLSEGDLYEGDLLEAVSGLPTKFWHGNAAIFRTFQNLVEHNSEQIKTELGERKFDQMKERVKAIARLI